jgi:spore maturation protein CgeB
MKVLVTSASSDSINSNAVLREFVGFGFSELLTEGNVFCCSLDYASEALKLHKPDLIVVFGSCMPDCCDYTGLKNYCIKSNAEIVFWLHDDPYEFDCNYKIFDYADFIFSNDRWSVIHIDHPRVFHLPLAASVEMHYRPIQSVFERDLFFCGVGFPNRRQFFFDCLEELAQFDVEVFGVEWPFEDNRFKNIRISSEILPDYYASSMATLNLGRRFNLANVKYQLDATTPGPRTFEAAMAGAVQCYHYETPEILDYFSNDEILIFDSVQDLKNILLSLKNDISYRNRIAFASQSRALKDHTYINRAQFIMNTVDAPFKALMPCPSMK